ncbi:hypothetical protein ABKN59_005635 [Abortiporus biennis]
MLSARFSVKSHPNSHLTPSLAFCLRVRFNNQHATQNPESEPHNHRASSKLFADAAQEAEAEREAEARAERLEAKAKQEYENWTGEERIQDAVLRMLVDKYKPLRTGVVRSAEDKLKQAPPKVNTSSSSEVLNLEQGQTLLNDGNITPGPRSMANVPLLPSIEGHQPWHTTFQVPSHASSSVKYGQMPPPPRIPTPLSAVDEKAQKKEKEMKKRTEQAGRLSRAKESTLDYKLGLGKGSDAEKSGRLRRANPVSMKGWTSLVEEKIEKARQEGQFKVIKGRGKPLHQVAEEKNPFIPREEFLLNRIVQRNGAAPPWVEIQGELETAVNTFRDTLRQSWTRRAIRMLTISHHPSLLTNLALSDVTSLRDQEWETRERPYHESAMEEINSLVRKYNGLAPYAVRRAYYMTNVELEKAYKDSGEGILLGIEERIRARASSGSASGSFDDDDSGGGGIPSAGSSTGSESPVGLSVLLRQWFSSFKFPGNSRSG